MMGFLRTRTKRAHGWICRRSRGHIREFVCSHGLSTLRLFSLQNAARPNHSTIANRILKVVSILVFAKTHNETLLALRAKLRFRYLRDAISAALIKWPFTASDRFLTRPSFIVLATSLPFWMVSVLPTFRTVFTDLIIIENTLR